MSSSALHLLRLRALVRRSHFAVGLIALRSRSVVELSRAAVSLTGLTDSTPASIDLALMTPDPDLVGQALSLMADGVLDACRIWSTVSAPESGESVLVSLRAVARDGDEVYALALFSALRRAAPMWVEERAIGDDAPVDLPRIDDLLEPLLELFDTAEALSLACLGRDQAALPELADLTTRQREILMRLMRGDRVPTISRGMHLSASTVRNHLATVYRKVGVHSQAELIERLHSVSE